MSQVLESVKDKFGKLVGVIITLAIIWEVGMILFGINFEADKTMLKDTDSAERRTSMQLLASFDDPGRFQVRYDYSVYAYIPKEKYMRIPYPDRDRAITKVGKMWCEGKGAVHWWYLPKVVLRDIHTGEDLASYRCFGEHVSKK